MSPLSPRPPWRPFLELEPLSRDGIPSLSTEDFLFALDVDKEEVLGSSVEGVGSDSGRITRVPEYDAGDVVGDEESGIALEERWMDCDEERRKEGYKRV